MAKRYIGDAIVTIEWDDRHQDYRGTISVDGKRWKFKGLRLGAMSRLAVDSAKAYDEAAASAVAFGSYYTTHNRGADTADWAPSASMADAIDNATSYVMDDKGNYEVKRSRSARTKFPFLFKNPSKRARAR